MACLHLGHVEPVVAQVRPADAVWLVGAGLVYLTPTLLGVTPSVPAPCGPCDRAALPAFDRWAVAPYRSGWSTGSWITGVAAVGLPVLDLWNEGPEGRARAMAVMQASSWAVAATELLKVTFARHRPLLYADPLEAGVLNDADSRQSFPSAHVAGSVAAAATYWWARRSLDGETTWRAWVPWALAFGTGVMRITAGKHFPSDVVGGAGVGLIGAMIVKEVRF